MGQGTRHGNVLIKEESQTDSDYERFNKLVVPDDSLILEGADEAHLTFSGIWVEKAASEFASYADAVTFFGATPGTIVLDGDETISTEVIQPATLFTRIAKGAKFVKSGSGAIRFQGIGLEDPRSSIPVFSGFANGDVTWTGTVWPKRVSSELQYYAHDRLGERLNFVDACLIGKKTTIEVHPRTIDTTQAVINQHHHLVFQAGDFPSTWNVPFVIPILLHSNTSLRSDPPKSARIYESSVAGDTNMAIIAAQMMAVPGAHGTCENIWVEDNYFVGDPAHGGSPGSSSVILGNVKNGGINRNTFYRTNGYNVLGGYGTSGNFAENATINDNVFIGCGTQVCAVINAKGFQIARNKFDQRNSTGFATYTPLDIEPNVANGRIENGWIEENEFDCRDIADGSKYLYAILVQATEVPSAKNLHIRFNDIYGADISESGTFNPLLVGIGIVGGSGVKCYGNYVRSTVQRGYLVKQSRTVEFYLNSGIQLSDVDNTNAALLINACADSKFHHNTFEESINTNRQCTGILENELEHTVSTSGTAITNLTSDGIFERFYDNYPGLNVVINTLEYEVDAFTSPLSISSTTTLETLAIKTFTSGNVDTGANSIAITAHAFKTGGRVWYKTSGSVVGGLSVRRYFVIRVDADNLKLADTEALALAGTPIDLTSGGSGTHSLVPVLVTKFSNNEIWGNYAPDGTTLEATGSSTVYNEATTQLSDFVPVDHSIGLIKLASSPINRILGTTTEVQVDPVTWRNNAGVTITGADNKLTKNTGVDQWDDSGAFSVQPVPVGGYVEWTCTENSTFRMIGLSSADGGLNITSIQYGAYMNPGPNVDAYRLGTYDGNSVSYVANTTVIRMSRVGTTIELSKDGAAPFHTFTSVPEDLMFIDTALYNNGATIGGVIIGGVGDVEALPTSEVKTLLAPVEWNNQTGTTYTLQASDNGGGVSLNNASAITLTVPAGLGAGFNVLILQKGAGQVTLSASSTTIRHRSSHLKTAGQWAQCALVAHAADDLTFSGDTAA